MAVLLVGLPGALGSSLRRQTPDPESLADPADVSRAAIGASTIETLKASQQSSEEVPAAQQQLTEPVVVDGVVIVAGRIGAAPVQQDDAVPASHMNMLERATQEVDKQTAQIVHAKPAASPALVSSGVCAKAAKEMQAMSCSLVNQISGYPEGCECRMKGAVCPAVRRDLGFTGVSPSVPHSPPELEGASVILCMYWQWEKPQDRSKEAAEAQEEVTEMAKSLVKTAHANAEQAAKVVATSYYAVTPAPVVLPPVLPLAALATPAPILQAVPFYGA